MSKIPGNAKSHRGANTSIPLVPGGQSFSSAAGGKSEIQGASGGLVANRVKQMKKLIESGIPEVKATPKLPHQVVKRDSDMAGTSNHKRAIFELRKTDQAELVDCAVEKQLEEEKSAHRHVSTTADTDDGECLIPRCETLVDLPLEDQTLEPMDRTEFISAFGDTQEMENKSIAGLKDIQRVPLEEDERNQSVESKQFKPSYDRISQKENNVYANFDFSTPSDDSSDLEWSSGEFDSEEPTKDANHTKRSSTVAKRSAKRIHNIVGELYRTEETYVEKLGLLLKFKAATQDILKTEYSKYMLPNLESIIQLHSDMLNKLRTRFDTWETNQRIGDIVSALGDILRLYPDYVADYEDAVVFVDTWKPVYSNFSLMLQKLTAEYGALDVKAFMIDPIQRVPRYKMLLEQYLKYFPEDQVEERHQVEEALQSVQSAAAGCEEALKKKEEDISETDDKLLNFVLDFMKTEESYNKTIYVLLKAKTRAKEILPSIDMTPLFPCIESIYPIHQELLTNLKLRIKVWESNKRIGDLVKDMGHFLKLYKDYVTNFAEAVAFVDKWKSVSRKFSIMLETVTSEHMDEKLDFEWHMFQPTQIVPRYIELFQQYLTLLSGEEEEEEEEERLAVEGALKAISNAASLFESAINQKLQRKLDISILEEGRKLTKRGEIYTVGRNSHRLHSRYLFLFNDMLLICKSGGFKSKYTTEQRLQVKGLKILGCKYPKFPNSVIIRNQSFSTELVFASGDEQTDWIKAIYAVIEQSRVENVNSTAKSSILHENFESHTACIYEGRVEQSSDQGKTWEAVWIKLLTDGKDLQFVSMTDRNVICRRDLSDCSLEMASWKCNMVLQLYDSKNYILIKAEDLQQLTGLLDGFEKLTGNSDKTHMQVKQSQRDFLTTLKEISDQSFRTNNESNIFKFESDFKTGDIVCTDSNHSQESNHPQFRPQNIPR